ncbi:MAG: cupin domain-containing protein [Nitrospirota bacterium]
MTTPITNLKDEMPVTRGAIASRPLLDIPGSMKLVLFAMDEGQEISAHTTLFPAQVHLLDGAISVMVDNAWTDLAPGDQKSLPKGVPHGVRAIVPSHWLLVMRRSARNE